MTEASCLYEKRGHVVLLTLNRPARRNALTPDVAHDLRESWLRYAADDDARVAVLWGGEGPSFCVGEDLKPQPDQARRTWPERWSPLDLEIWKPTIAAVNGHAIAGGCWLTTTCHLCVAADTAVFGIGAPRWNIGSSDQADLPRLIGLRNAIELTIFPRFASARRAYEIGLVNWIVPKGCELAKAMDVARSIAENDPAVVRASIESYYRCYGMERGNAVRLARRLHETAGGASPSAADAADRASSLTPARSGRGTRGAPPA